MKPTYIIECSPSEFKDKIKAIEKTGKVTSIETEPIKYRYSIHMDDIGGLEGENWVDMDGVLAGLYEISNKGRVRVSRRKYVAACGENKFVTLLDRNKNRTSKSLKKLMKKYWPDLY